MARDDWEYVNLDKDLMKVVGQAAKSVKVFGALKYRDKKDFVTKATIALLKEEGFDTTKVAGVDAK